MLLEISPLSPRNIVVESCDNGRRHSMEFPEDSTPSRAESETEARDPLRKYLGEISQHPLMTREEEHEMALRVRMDGDKEAGQKLVLANLRLVVKIALEYHSHHDLLDLIQEGNIGLVRAVRKYDPEKGTRFTTYASFWIRAYILKYLMDSWSLVKVGTKESQRKLFFRLNREKERLERSGISPSAEVLAENLEASTTEIEEMEQRLYHGDLSLEEPQHGDGNPLMDTIGSGEDVEEKIIKKDQTELLHKKLGDFKKLLSERECFILDNRIIAEDPLTLRQIGERFKTSRERIRQIQAKLSRRLESNLRSSEILPS
jgi:RNA polymerase sigma-32 factor